MNVERPYTEYVVCKKKKKNLHSFLRKQLQKHSSWKVKSSIPHQVSHIISYVDSDEMHSVGNAWSLEDLSKVHLAFLI